MCGIYVTNIKYDKVKVKNKLKSIEFRGPDNMGYSKIRNISLGHLRLSILDLEERSNQPFQLGKYYIVFNGEIYNYLEVKKNLTALGHCFKTSSDTEVLLAGYIEWGSRVLELINGMFAFCIYDTEKNKIFSARDRLGVKPFYYFWNNGSFEICSQIKPLNEHKKISEDAIGIYLECGYIPSPYSIFENIYKLPPGCMMTIDLENNIKKINRYWDLHKVKVEHIPYKKAVTKLHGLIKDAVKIRLQSDVSIGTFLSGGIDSALISAVASDISNNQINTFSIGFKEKKYDESKIAEQYGNIIGSNHKTTLCSAKDALKLITRLTEAYDEPFADSSALPSLLLNSITKKDVTVALSGDGGDESFLGYNYFDKIQKYKWLYYIPKILRKNFTSKYLARVLGKNPEIFHSYMTLPNITSLIKSVFVSNNSLNTKNTAWFQKYSPYLGLSSDVMQKAADLNIKLWLENDSNVKVDRASMAFSVEVRSPFLDYRIIEFARTLPTSYRYEKNRKKKILRDILSEYIPEKVFNQPKKGFSIPLGKWLKNELKQDVEKLLNDEFLTTLPNFNIIRFKKQLSHHMNGKAEHTNDIWRVYVLAKWYKQYGNLSA